jgi:hypothetical protein
MDDSSCTYPVADCKEGPSNGLLTKTRHGLKSHNFGNAGSGPGDNRHCVDFGYDYGVKIDGGCQEKDDVKFMAIGNKEGTCATETDGKVDVDCSGSGTGATITSEVDVVVIMKAAKGGVVYYLPAGQKVDLDCGNHLHKKGKVQDISHINFCFVCNGCNGGTARRTLEAPRAQTEQQELSELRGSVKEDPSSHVQCRVAYAYHSATVSKSFKELGFSEGNLFDDTDITFGWSNGPLATSNYAYSFEMYSADKFKMMGTMTVTYDEEAMVIIEAGERLWLKSVNAYVGHSRLPVGEDGMEVIDPAQMPISHEKMSLSRSFTVSELDGSTPIYVVAEATICGVFTPTEKVEAKKEGVLDSVSGYLKKFL